MANGNSNTNQITSIQIRENVKNQLDRIKTIRQSYEEVIVNLLKETEEKRRKEKELLIEGCKEMAVESLRMTKDWETTDASLDWKW